MKINALIIRVSKCPFHSSHNDMDLHCAAQANYIQANKSQLFLDSNLTGSTGHMLNPLHVLSYQT